MFVCAVLMLSFASCGGGESALHGSAVDSLLHRLSTERYSSLDALQGAADSLSVMTTDDEAQMIADPFRGHNWTRAILGLSADEIHVCLAPEAKKKSTFLTLLFPPPP